VFEVAYNTGNTHEGIQGSDVSEVSGTKLPHLENAVIAKAKMVGYLLSETHTSGKEKAAFFLRFGFTSARWEVLRDALLEHAADYPVADIVSIPYGVNYVIKGELKTPDGRTPRVRVVWCIDHDSNAPRLITAYPE
jgi:hypothetical protein